MQENRDSVKILMLGTHSRWIDRLARELQRMQFEVVFRTVKEQLRLEKEHSAGCAGEDGPARPGTGNCMVLVPDFGQGSGDNWQELLEFTELLKTMCAGGLQAALLVSDTAVYGKLFGTAHSLKEDEIGYVCHSDPQETGLQCMRTMEHFCSRFARERGVPVKIARADRARIQKACGTEETGDGEHCPTDVQMGKIAEGMVQIMRKGAPGEAYNLPEVSEDEKTGSGYSPLSPIPIVTDSGKAGML